MAYGTRLFVAVGSALLVLNCYVPQFPIAHWFWRRSWLSYIRNSTYEYWLAMPILSSGRLHFVLINCFCYLLLLAAYVPIAVWAFFDVTPIVAIEKLATYALDALACMTVLAILVSWFSQSRERFDMQFVVAVVCCVLLFFMPVMISAIPGDAFTDLGKRRYEAVANFYSQLGVPSFAIALVSLGIIELKGKISLRTDGALSANATQWTGWLGVSNVAFADICLSSSAAKNVLGSKFDTFGAVAQLPHFFSMNSSDRLDVMWVVSVYFFAWYDFPNWWAIYGKQSWIRRNAVHARILQALSPHMLKNVLGSINVRLSESGSTIQRAVQRLSPPPEDVSPSAERIREHVAVARKTIAHELDVSTEAIAGVSRFSNWLHLAAKKDGQYWPLLWELRSANDYLSSMRHLRPNMIVDFDAAFTFLDLGETHRRFQIPVMLLQPLVENAFKHGIFDAEINAATISVSVRVDSHCLLMVVTTSASEWAQRGSSKNYAAGSRKTGTGTAITAQLVRRWSHRGTFTQGELPSGTGFMRL